MTLNFFFLSAKFLLPVIYPISFGHGLALGEAWAGPKDAMTATEEQWALEENEHVARNLKRLWFTGGILVPFPLPR